MGSKIHSVTHLNTYAPSRSAKTTAVDTYAKLVAGEELNEAVEVKGFMRNPTIVKQEADAMAMELELARDALDGFGRCAAAEELKGGANSAFKAGKNRVAIVGYIAGIWHLWPGRPACPPLLAHVLASGAPDDAEASARLASISRWLRTPNGTSGTGSKAEEDDETLAAESLAGAAAAAEAAAVSLLHSLHLNTAAAALKLEDWELAKAACEVVLAAEPCNSKAQFRLAKAHEGEGDLSLARAVIVQLLQHDNQNAEARKLHEALKKRQADEKGRFAGMFEAAAS